MTKHWLSGGRACRGSGVNGPLARKSKWVSPDRSPTERRVRRATCARHRLQAVGYINKAGGILGQQITLEQGDDVSDPKQGVSGWLSNLVGDGVKFVVGHFNSGVTISRFRRLCGKRHLVHHPVGQRHPQDHRAQALGRVPYLRPRRPARHAVGLCGARQPQGQEDLGRSRQDDLRQRACRRRARQHAQNSGVKEVLYEGVNTGEKDYLAIVSKIKEFGRRVPRCGAACRPRVALIVRQMRDQGLKTIMDCRQPVAPP